MSLYDDIDCTDSKKAGGFSTNKINLTFLKTQLAAKKAQLQNTHKNFNSLPAPVINLTGQKSTAAKSAINLKPRKAVPLPLDGTGGFTIVPKALKEEKVFLFGEITVDDEYNPTAPNDYAGFKQKRDAQRVKERIAKEIADRLHKQHAEEEAKRRSGAAIAPPQALIEQDAAPPAAPPTPPAPAVVLDTTPHFGKGATRGLGIAANIMSKMGYRQGAGLGRSQQGMSTALRVEQTGKNTGMIISEGGRFVDAKEELMDDDDDQPPVNDELWVNESVKNEPTDMPNTSSASASQSITEKLKSASKVVLLQNMVHPSDVDSELEAEIREEMKKYGQLNNVLIHVVPNAAVDEAVRIFLEFTNLAQAIKAVVDLNGRFFGGRAIQPTFYAVDDFANRRLEK